MRGWCSPLLLLSIGCTDSSQTLTVYAASSLREVMSEIAADYEAAHPGVDVELVFAGSQTLRIQAEAGAAFDLFVSAHPAYVEALHRAELCEAPRLVARNRLSVVVPQGSPLNSFEALPEVERVVLGTPEVPVGRYADLVLEAAEGAYGDAWRDRVAERVVSRERNVRLVRAKVQLGEADAAIVYATDVQGEGLRGVPIPRRLSPVAEYAAAAQGPKGAAFFEWLVGPRGRARLEGRGFEAP